MQAGKHQDSNPQGGVPFAIPVLYAKGRDHERQFINGDVGRPWLITLIVYVADEAFCPTYQMGTAFYQKDGTLALRADCLHMRLVFFESDLFHSMEESNLPPDVKSWRVSYVFKLVVNPTKPCQNLKESFREWVRGFALSIEDLPLGAHFRA